MKVLVSYMRNNNKMEIELYKKVEKALKEFNLKYEMKDDYFYVYTKFGWWRIRPEHENRSKIVTIFTRFEKPEIINKDIFKQFDYNSFSGKLNFHRLTKYRKNMLVAFNNLCGIVSANMICE